MKLTEGVCVCVEVHPGKTLCKSDAELSLKEQVGVNEIKCVGEGRS